MKPVTEPIPAVPVGKIERIPNFPSKYVSPRHVDVWLPEGYDENGRYATSGCPVLYMHDGQMLFDASMTWNKQAWGVADVMSSLAVRPCIVVGIWNSDSGRWLDYLPKRPFDTIPQSMRDHILDSIKQRNGIAGWQPAIQSDNYLKFIVEELKPHIDRTYATLPDRDNTVVAGSSMGGLISMYAICEYPDVFSGAACLSTHWVGIDDRKNNPFPDAFVAYLQGNLPDPASHKFYFDYGTEKLDALYEPHQLRVDAVMKSKGYDGSNWQTRKFVGDGHSEVAWNGRLHIPLTFLLGSGGTDAIR